MREIYLLESQFHLNLFSSILIFIFRFNINIVNYKVEMVVWCIVSLCVFI